MHILQVFLQMVYSHLHSHTFIGDRFKSLYQGVDLGQDDGIDNNDLVRNTFPYRIKDDYASNDYLNRIFTAK